MEKTVKQMFDEYVEYLKSLKGYRARSIEAHARDYIDNIARAGVTGYSVEYLVGG